MGPEETRRALLFDALPPPITCLVSAYPLAGNKCGLGIRASRGLCRGKPEWPDSKPRWPVLV